MFRKNIFNVTKLNQLELWNLDEVKNYLRVSHDYDDKVIKNLIISAIDSAENFLGLSLHQRNVEFISNVVGRRVFQLKYSPVIEITDVTFEMTGRTRQLAKNEYSYDAEYAALYLTRALAGEELKVSYTTGYENHNIPHTISQGVLLHICSMYDREGDNALSMSNEVKDLYQPYKKIRL